MKRIVAILFGVSLIAAIADQGLASYVVHGEDVVLTFGSPRGVSGGGPFILTGAKGPFATFCLEVGEFVGNNQTYYATVERGAIFGGAKPEGDEADDANNGSEWDPVNGYQIDYISNATARLYLDYRTGALGMNVADYTNSEDGNDALQRVFWQLEEESSIYGSLAVINIANKILEHYTAPVDWDDEYTGTQVRVVNLWANKDSAYTWDGKRQSMLTLVPEPASMVVWSLIGLIFGVGLSRRRRR